MGMIIPGPDSAAYAEENGRFSFTVNRIGGDVWRQEFAWAVWVDGNLLGNGDELEGPDGPADALSAMTYFLAEDVERWRATLEVNFAPDAFNFGPDVARWAYEHAPEIQLAGEAAQLWAQRR